MDVIKQSQISLRKEAELLSYDPDDTPLPNLPSVKETLAELDPSPPYLRCKHRKGGLLRGVQTLTYVFCGRKHCKDLLPDPINFRDTLGYRWLLQYLRELRDRSLISTAASKMKKPGSEPSPKSSAPKRRPEHQQDITTVPDPNSSRV
ncbi:hypothetical protein ACFX13_015792 [Malus domestica]